MSTTLNSMADVIGNTIREEGSMTMFNTDIVEVKTDIPIPDADLPSIEAILVRTASTETYKANISDFTELKELGAGTFGTTFSAHHIDTGNTIVLKRIGKATSSLANVEREINILEYLKDVCTSYVICYISSFEDEQYYYIVTEFLGNYITLFDYIEEYKGTQSYDVSAVIITNLIRGIQSIHGRHISHRDIKPENIMINPTTQEIKYVDFGLSCYDGVCEILGIVGSRIYKAPELWYKPPNTRLTYEQWKRADLWSLGKTIVELLITKDFYTGRFEVIDLPYIEQHRPDLVELYFHDPETMRQQQNATIQRFIQDPDMPSYVERVIPTRFRYTYPTLTGYIIRMMEHNPSDRVISPL